MSEDNKNIGMNMTNKNLEFEEESDSTEKSVPMGDIYKYTNKGKLHEFNLGLLTPQERKKFDKMSNKEKQRFIASVELQQMPSMFDEISLKSVVYPDPDSNIADVQAAAAKYNELVKLEEDPKFKQMIQGYLKFEEVQKYIIKYCPHISQNDIDLLVKLKPDITVYQFINYYKNIMNDKNLVELNNIQKQLKNPYSDDILKEVLNKGEQISKNILQLIVNCNIGQLKLVKEHMEAFADSKNDTTMTLNPTVANIIGMSPNVEYSKYSPQQYKTFHTLYNVISNLISDVKERCTKLSKSLTEMGTPIKSDQVFNDIMCDKEVYEALQKYIEEKAWKEAIMNIPGIGMDLDNPTTKANIKKENENRTQEEKDTKDKERAERLEERRKKDEEMRKQYELTMPREEQKIDVEPIDTENGDILENDIFSSIDSSTYPVMSIDTINDINTPQPQQETPPRLPKENPHKEEINQKLEELDNLIVNRLYEVSDKNARLMTPDSQIYLTFDNGKPEVIIYRNKQKTTKIKTLCNKVRAALRANTNIGMYYEKNLDKAPNTKEQRLPGYFETDEMKKLMKSIIKLGGSIFSKIKNTFKAPEEIRETKMKLAELSEKTVENNKSLRELEKTIEELTNRVNELSKQVGKSYVERKISKPSFLDDITKPQILKPVKKPEEKQPQQINVPQENPDSMEEQIRRKLEERRRDLEPDYSEESEEEWGEGLAGKIKIESSDTKKPIPMSDFFKKYL